MAVERNGCGTDVCNRIFYDCNYPHFVSYGTAGASTPHNFRPGIICNNNTKSPAVVHMKYYLCDSWKLKIHDRRFAEELKKFNRTKNNKWQAEIGYHDDIVMSVVWALYPLHRNLINDYFVVDSVNKQGMPVKIFNKFTYELSPDYKLEYTTDDIRDYPHLPVILRGDAKLDTRVGIFETTGLETMEELLMMGWTEL